ncbi:porin [Candidatus Purcelliella pentastirinorum]|uniref:Porin n=1 Tax=Candidatus Purcelliella pentastirinorum TaxID=472834 RepID=A0AAX3N8T7_9ENTR|nr:porin [Candidatus Purcelliella pentastirinorum]WDI78517.1 porin [Candidatus Purcelliella pentastirinorum]WDR80454.1 porin [Candidatus Purcelliella pentastirinorum]
MIKRNIITIILTISLMMSNIVNAIEIYNKNGNKINIYGSINILRKFSNGQYNKGDKSYTKLGLKNEHFISKNIIGYSTWLYEFHNDLTESQYRLYNGETCLAYAGLNFKKWGSIDYGRNYGILYDSLSYTDKLPVENNLSIKDNDNFLSRRATSLLTYRNKDLFGYFKGINIAIQYAGKNLYDRIEEEKNCNGWGGSLEYKSDIGLSTIGSWFNVNRTDIQKEDNNGNKSIAYALGLKYDKNNIYVGAIYGNSKNLHRSYNDSLAKQTKNIEFIAQYKFNNIYPSISFLQRSINNSNPAAFDSMVIDKYINLGAIYDINKNISAYADYRINLIKDKSNTSYRNSMDNIFAIGMSYKF